MYDYKYKSLSPSLSLSHPDLSINSIESKPYMCLIIKLILRVFMSYISVKSFRYTKKHKF